jgi:hypothetical protein
MTTDELTRQGIAALKAGNHDQARDLLKQVVDQDPHHQVALLWLTAVVTDNTEKRQYLERVVAINPDNDLGKRAAAGLAQLGPSSAPAADPIPNPLGSAPSTQQAPAGDETFVSPQPFGMPSSAPAESAPSPFGVPSSDTSSSQPAQSMQSMPFNVPDAPMAPAPKKQSNTLMWVVGIVSAVILLPCLCGGIGIVALGVLGEQVSESAGTVETWSSDSDYIPSYPSTVQGSVMVGESVTGNLNSLFEADDWTFSGTQGDRITIRCEAARGHDTDPRVHLVGPDGSLVAADDDGGSGYDSLVSNVVLPSTGQYIIKIDVFEEGDYVLSID